MRWLIVGGALAACLALGACKQGVGDRCNLDSDCESGLICDTHTSSPQAGGVCIQPNSGGGDAAVRDMTPVPHDQSMND